MHSLPYLVISAGVVLVLCVGSIGGCNRGPTKSYTSARVVLFGPMEAVVGTTSLDDPAKIDAVLRYLSGLDSTRHTNFSGRWTPDVTIELTTSDGTVRRIAVGGDFQYWCDSDRFLGDRTVQPGFEQHVRQLFD
jgi:hypothetical protein